MSKRRIWVILVCMALAIVAAGGRAIAQDAEGEVAFSFSLDAFVHVVIGEEEDTSEVTSAVVDIWWKYIRLCGEEEWVWLSDAPDRYTTSDLLAIKSSIMMELIALLEFDDLVNVSSIEELMKGMDGLIKVELLDYVNEQMELNPLDLDLQLSLEELKAKIIALAKEEERVWASDDPDRFATSSLMELKTRILIELLELSEWQFVGVDAVDWMIKAVESLVKAESMFYIGELPCVAEPIVIEFE